MIKFLCSMVGMDRNNRIKNLVKCLESNGVVKFSTKCNNGCSNDIYISRDGKTVLIIIKTYKYRSNIDLNQIHPVLIDLEDYNRFVGNKVVSVSDSSHTKNNKIDFKRYKPSIFLNGKRVLLHPLVMGIYDYSGIRKPGTNGIEVDHINHMTTDCTRSNLRICTNVQNSSNKPMRCKVHKSNNQFYFTCKFSKKPDYSFVNNIIKNVKTVGKDYLLVSNMYSTENELYLAINEFENKMFGQYRYNPFIDFEETWYAYTLYRMGVISYNLLHEFQKMYFNHVVSDEMKKYYQFMR